VDLHVSRFAGGSLSVVVEGRYLRLQGVPELVETVLMFVLKCLLLAPLPVLLLVFRFLNPL
jgi:hypothetical protein